MNLVLAEQHDGILNRVSWEVISVAQQIDGPVKVLVAGQDVGSVAEELAQADVDEVIIIDDADLEPYTSDGHVQALAQAITSEKPEVVLFSHTYQARDFAPKLAARFDRALIADCIGAKSSNGTTVFVRPMFQGKFVADVVSEGSSPHFASFQIGVYRADEVKRVTTNVPIRTLNIKIDSTVIRQRPEPPFKEAKQAVDLTQAERIIAVGRGIKGEEHLALAQKLAKAFNAELAASRPICDAGWLPMDRQVGSSGQTVAPKLYLALGISGAIQHLIGMKGSHTIVAINKDADAPIFEVADYGIVGDLFEVVPELISALGNKVETR